MKAFEKNALSLSMIAIENCLENSDIDKNEITHLITFSCTGMYAPGIDTEIIENLNLSKDIDRTCINFMGCYAAIVALKNAWHIARSKPQAVILIVGVELCSLHHSDSADPEQLIANAIFSDGASAVLLSAKPEKKQILEVVDFYSVFAPDGKKDMTWRIGDISFELYLSSYVPKLLNKELEKLTEKLLEKVGIQKTDIHYYAIHPGGMAILKACEAALGIDSKQNECAYKVLNKFGNMSSVTVLFVLNELLGSIKKEDKDKNIISFAFGPGLTMESMLLKTV
jgi:alpha-pyrone synthase